MNTMNAKMANTMRMNPIMFQKYSGVPVATAIAFAMVMPAVDRMPTKMMSEVPLPTPYSVIRSPSHMTMTEPPMSMMTMSVMVR